MSLSQGLRWSGRGISNGRQRLVASRCDIRHYSLNSRSTPYSSSYRAVAGKNRTCGLKALQQHRSLSFFGWGSSQPSSDEFASAHNRPSAPPPTSNTSQTSEAVSPVIESSRSVKASHATSDVPDPSILQARPLNEVEPPALKSLEESIALPHGSTATSDAAVPDFASIPEGIGYLKDVCGLDYGWGPTATLEWVLEHLHISAGLSWSVSIVALALLGRLCVIKFAINGSDQAVKMREMQPVIAPLRKQYTEALTNSDKAKAMAVANEIKAISKEAGISTWAMFLPIITQIPLTFGGFRLLRGASALPVPAFETETWLWHTDLTMADPFILPAITAGFTFLTLRANTKAGTTTLSPQIMTIMLYGLPTVSLLFIHFQPGAVQLYFLINGIFSWAQAAVIRNPHFRNMLKMSPLQASTPKNPEQTTQTPAIGGLRMRRGGLEPPVTSTPLDVGSSNRSMIDKAVDNFKESRDDAVKSVKSTWTTVLGQSAEKQAENKKKRASAQAEKYEYTRRQDLEVRREYRNRAAATGGERETRQAGEASGLKASRNTTERQKKGR